MSASDVAAGSCFTRGSALCLSLLTEDTWNVVVKATGGLPVLDAQELEDENFLDDPW